MNTYGFQFHTNMTSYKYKYGFCFFPTQIDLTKILFNVVIPSFAVSRPIRETKAVEFLCLSKRRAP